MNPSEIERLLPSVFQRTLDAGSPLAAILDAMAALHAPSEQALATLDRIFNAYRTPDAFVPYLAHWLDLDRFLPESATRPEAGEPIPAPLAARLGRWRELIAAAAQLSQWRGTAYGLCQFLETATGTTGFQVDEAVPGPDGLPRPYHIRVRAPDAARPETALIERIVEQEKPAYVTWELEFVASP
jgi:phage tail-like protein